MKFYKHFEIITQGNKSHNKKEVNKPAAVNVRWRLTGSLLHSMSSMTSQMPVDSELSDSAFD